MTRTVVADSSAEYRYVYDGAADIRAYRDGSCHQTTVFGRSADEAVAMIDQDGQGWYYACDRIGSTRALTDASGAVVEMYDYTAFGMMKVMDPDGSSPGLSGYLHCRRYGGREFDSESELWYFRNRYLDPRLGRFLQRDGAGYRDGLNMYAYVRNSPLRYTDPDGRTARGAYAGVSSWANAAFGPPAPTAYTMADLGGNYTYGNGWPSTMAGSAGMLTPAGGASIAARAEDWVIGMGGQQVFSPERYERPLGEPISPGEQFLDAIFSAPVHAAYFAKGAVVNTAYGMYNWVTQTAVGAYETAELAYYGAKYALYGDESSRDQYFSLSISDPRGQADYAGPQFARATEYALETKGGWEAAGTFAWEFTKEEVPVAGTALRMYETVRDPIKGGSWTYQDSERLGGIGGEVGLIYLTARYGNTNLWGGKAPAAVSGIVRTNAELVQEIAARAEAWGTRQGLGSGPVAGKLKHGYAADLLTRYQEMFGDRGMSTEVRYVNGSPWRPGRPVKGSVIPDVVEGPLEGPTAVWDYKFGGAKLTPARINEIRTGAGFDPTVPVLPVHP